MYWLKRRRIGACNGKESSERRLERLSIGPKLTLNAQQCDGSQQLIDATVKMSRRSFVGFGRHWRLELIPHDGDETGVLLLEILHSFAESFVLGQQLVDGAAGWCQ